MRNAARRTRRIAALERERDANRLKDEFLATLSHELRTPLNAVLGWTRVLRSTSGDVATQERGLESIERNARAQARLIEDLLEVSRIVTGKLRLQVRAGRSRGHRRHGGRDRASRPRWPSGCALTVQIDVRPALTQGDPDRLQQVVWNLLSNAVKFTPPDGAVIVELTSSKDGYVLTVQDSGPGIDAKFLPYVFERVPAGRRQRDPRAWRARPRPRHRQAARRSSTAARSTRASAGTRSGRDVRGVPALGRRTGADPPACVIGCGRIRDTVDSSLLTASTCWSWTTRRMRGCCCR